MASAIIGFDAQKLFTQEIEISDLGNCAIRCTNKDFEEFYLCTQTIMGKTYLLKFGPIVADIAELTDDFELSYKKIDYKEKIIEREINLLINDVKKKINQVEIVELKDVLSMIPTSDRFIPA